MQRATVMDAWIVALSVTASVTLWVIMSPCGEPILSSDFPKDECDMFIQNVGITGYCCEVVSYKASHALRILVIYCASTSDL
jgi:hypothetical protein